MCEGVKKWSKTYCWFETIFQTNKNQILTPFVAVWYALIAYKIKLKYLFPLSLDCTNSTSINHYGINLWIHFCKSGAKPRLR